MDPYHPDTKTYIGGLPGTSEAEIPAPRRSAAPAKRAGNGLNIYRSLSHHYCWDYAPVPRLTDRGILLSPIEFSTIFGYNQFILALQFLWSETNGLSEL